MSNTIRATTRSIPLFTPEIRGNEWKYVKDCLDTAWVSSVGSYVDQFESRVAERAGVRHAVAVVNGTAALHTALKVAGIRENDEVLVSTLTFIASANSIRFQGAFPVLIDAEPQFGQIDPNLVEYFLTKRCQRCHGEWLNRATGRRVSAIMPVHILGHPVDLEPILEIADKFSLIVVEDAAEGLGVLYRNRPVGSFGRVGCLSFNGNKLITTGGGGMILTNDEQLAKRARYLTTTAKDDAVEFVHGEVGFNYRLTNIQAAVGCGQLENLDQYILRKRQIADRFRGQLADIAGIRFYTPADYAFCTYWMNTIAVNPDEFGIDSRELRTELSAEGVQSRPLWQPMHQSPAHRHHVSELRGIADSLYTTYLNIPSSVGLTDEDVDYVCESIRSIHRRHFRRTGRAA